MLLVSDVCVTKSGTAYRSHCLRVSWDDGTVSLLILRSRAMDFREAYSMLIERISNRGRLSEIAWLLQRDD